MSSIVDRVLCLVENDSLNANQIASKLGLTHSSFSDWKRGKSKPSVDAIIKLAEYFNVSTDYILIGKGTLFADKENLIPEKCETLDFINDDISEIIEILKSLPQDLQRECIGIIKGYAYACNSSSNSNSLVDKKKA